MRTSDEVWPEIIATIKQSSELRAKEKTTMEITDQIREHLSDKQHQIWSSWMAWVFKICPANPDGSVTIPPELVERWTRQINTPYWTLSEKEKDSDRHQADKIIAVLNEHKE